MSIESWLLEEGMTSRQILARLIEREGSINAVALRLGWPASQISATVNYLRLNLAIRKDLIQTYGVRFSPHIKPSYSWRKPRKKQLQEVTTQ